jgi:Zn-dependent M28 family amino/carboxypeptidase
VFPSLPHLHLPPRKHAPLPPPTPAIQALADELRRDITILATDIGERHTRAPKPYRLAEDFCASALRHAGYEVARYPFQADGMECRNLEATLFGTKHPEQIILLGAHYDSVWNCPAANDNASGIAGTLAIARRLAGRPLPRTVRFVCFANEEPPHFHSETMGSWVYAKLCRQRGDDIRAMFTLETIGCFLHEPGSQRWPHTPFAALLPKVADFILNVGNTRSAEIVKLAADAFRARTPLPMLSVAIPNPLGDMGWSDHWGFQQEGFPAFMITDTALFRYNHYHRPSDTPDKLDYLSMAHVVDGMLAATIALAGGDAGAA